MSDPNIHDVDPSLKEPGTDDQPGEFIDTPENQPGDQDSQRLSDVANPKGFDDADPV